MATLHQQYVDFNSKISLTDSRKESLKTSRKDLRKKIRKWFKDNKEDHLQPKFGGQGSFMMGTTVNPIPVDDGNGTELRKYDLDDGVYFIEKEGENNRQEIEIWRDWILAAVDGHTATPAERHKACIRVIFADGHHIDLPIYYKTAESIELGHRDDGWIESDPKEFYEWFNRKANPQLKRIVRYLKAWKNYQETEDSKAFIANGVSLTILAASNYKSHDNDDMALADTVNSMRNELNDDFECLRPTTPEGEDLFNNVDQKSKDSFLNKLNILSEACAEAKSEPNQRKASELLREQFGQRFPLADDVDESAKSQSLASSLSNASVKPVPYAD